MKMKEFWWTVGAVVAGMLAWTLIGPTLTGLFGGLFGNRTQGG